MVCKEVAELLADYSADNLSGGAARQVREHLAGCAECRAHLAGLQAVGRLVAEMESVETPAQVWQTIQARGERFFPSPTRAPGRRQLRWAFASALTALVILALSVFFSLRYMQPRPPDVLFASPATVGYQAQGPTPQGSLAGYFNQHAATASGDTLSDPVSLGLVSYTTRQPEAGQPR